MNITITGTPGAGKSSVCNVLKNKGYEVVKAGELFRQIAEENNFSVIRLNEYAENDRRIDDLLDERTAKLGKEKDNTVFDSRMAWHFIPNSFKVFLQADVKETAKRVFRDSRDTENYKDICEAKCKLQYRAKMEQERFLRLYGVDYQDTSHYDLVIDTTNMTPEKTAEMILSSMAERK